jgi:hypothetical protein
MLERRGRGSLDRTNGNGHPTPELEVRMVPVSDLVFVGDLLGEVVLVEPRPGHQSLAVLVATDEPG